MPDLDDFFRLSFYNTNEHNLKVKNNFESQVFTLKIFTQKSPFLLFFGVLKGTSTYILFAWGPIFCADLLRRLFRCINQQMNFPVLTVSFREMWESWNNAVWLDSAVSRSLTIDLHKVVFFLSSKVFLLYNSAFWERFR